MTANIFQAGQNSVVKVIFLKFIKKVVNIYFCNDKYHLHIHCVQCISFIFSGQTSHAYKTKMYTERKNSTELTLFVCVCVECVCVCVSISRTQSYGKL